MISDEHPSDALISPQITKPDRIISSATREFLGDVRSEDNNKKKSFVSCDGIPRSMQSEQHIRGITRETMDDGTLKAGFAVQMTRNKYKKREECKFSSMLLPPR